MKGEGKHHKPERDLSMSMNQIVFVVVDSKAQKVLGAFNEKEDAVKVAMDMEKPGYSGEEISITPVLVDRVNWLTDSRQFWLDNEDVDAAVKEEMELAMPVDEDEDDEDENEEYEDFDDSEDDPDYGPDDEEDDDDEESFNELLNRLYEVLLRHRR